MTPSTEDSVKKWTFKAPKNAGNNLPTHAEFGLTAPNEASSSLDQIRAHEKEILEKRAWDVCLTPGKSIFMNLFMIWMMGSGSGIFSILVVGYAVMQSFQSLFRVNNAFQSISGKISTIQYKLIYVAINLAVLGYLCNHAAGMGLFPINSGDWIASFPTSRIPERSIRI